MPLFYQQGREQMEQYTVTRQLQFPNGTPVVEVSLGGIDYTNPDALSEKYPGEFEEFNNPVEAVEAVIGICRAWRKDGTPKARVGIGYTGGSTMPFETCTYKQAREWAATELESLERCDLCGDLLPDAYFVDEFGEGQYCSEYCAEKAVRNCA